MQPCGQEAPAPAASGQESGPFVACAPPLGALEGRLHRVSAFPTGRGPERRSVARTQKPPPAPQPAPSNRVRSCGVGHARGLADRPLPCLPPSLSSCSVACVERVGGLTFKQTCVASCLNVVNFIVKGIIFCLLWQTCNSRLSSKKCPFYSFCLLMSVRLKNKINNNKIMKNNKTGRWQVPNRQESFTSSGLHGLQVISSQEICA